MYVKSRVENKKQGFGRYVYLSGDVYQGKIIVNYNKKGDWFNNKKQGYGTLLKADGSKFEGLFQDSYQ